MLEITIDSRIRIFIGKVLSLRSLLIFLCLQATLIYQLVLHTGWIKRNCDGAFASGKVACGAIFINNLGQFLGCFAEGLNFGNSLIAELSGAMRSIKLTSSKN